MSLEECISKHTYRQYIAWLEWLDRQWDIPTRIEFYLMQIAMEVRRVLSKFPNKIKLLDFMLKRGDGKNEDASQPKDAEEATRIAQSKYLPLIAAAKAQPSEVAAMRKQQLAKEGRLIVRPPNGKSRTIGNSPGNPHKRRLL